MTKTIYCKGCGRCIKIEGPTEGGREVPERVTCPYCKSLNEVTWPIGEAYKVGRCDGDEIPE